MAKKLRKDRAAVVAVAFIILSGSIGFGIWKACSGNAQSKTELKSAQNTGSENTSSSDHSSDPSNAEHPEAFILAKEAAAGSVVDIENLSQEQKEQLFYIEPLSDQQIESMEGVTFSSSQDFITTDDLRLVRVLYKNFDGNDAVGELIVNMQIAAETLNVFKELYQIEYPIEKIVLPDVYDGDDQASMLDDNTSAFSFRFSDGSGIVRHEHSLGLAIDLNPYYNPQVIEYNGEILTFPYTAKEYADRNAGKDHMLSNEDPAVQIFEKYGFEWGGNWAEKPDYAHFEKYYDPSMFQIYPETAEDNA